MHSFNQLNYKNHFAKLGESFASSVTPQVIENAHILSINHDIADKLGLQLDYQHQQLVDLLACKWLPEKSNPIATIYSGHQFGAYNPQLGDGRALLLGQIENSHGELWELQLKGSGTTPFSRHGDGRAVLRSSIREYLCSAAMQGLGIPTTHALAIATSSTAVQRESTETAATILRVAPSHIRFGHFEYFYYTKQFEELKKLTNFVIQHHYPQFNHLDDKDKYPAFLTEVVKRTARLIASWQAQGFSHGVLNSDNMSILGITLDYGPFGFLDDFNPEFICNHSDHDGRYAFNQQINIGLWNLNALAHSLSPLLDVNAIKTALKQYEIELKKYFGQRMRLKLGLLTEQESDATLIQSLFKLMVDEKIDYSYFFRSLCHLNQNQSHEIRGHFINREAFDNWYALYKKRFDSENSNHEKQLEIMRRNNPKFILRNYLAQWAIDDAEKGNNTTLNELLTVLQSPFEEHEEFDKFAKLPPSWGKKLQVSCSS